MIAGSHPTNLPPPPHAPIMHPNVIADPRMQLVQSPIAIPIINAGQSMPVSVPSMSAVPAGAVLSKPPLVPGPSADVQMRKLIKQKNMRANFVLYLIFKMFFKFGFILFFHVIDFILTTIEICRKLWWCIHCIFSKCSHYTNLWNL